MDPIANTPREGLVASDRVFRVVVGLLFAAYLLSARRFVIEGQLNQDEGWYLHAARLVWEGLIPYRDFAFFQAPLLPYVYGLPQVVFGSGLEVGRSTSLVLGAITIALGARLSWERGGRAGALLFLALAPVTPLLLWSYTTTRTEPLNALLLTASASFLLRRASGPLDAGAAGAFAVLAVATRVSSLPFAILVFVWIAIRHRDSTRALVVGLAPGGVVAFLFALFIVVAGPEAVMFDLVTRQVERQSQLRPQEAWSLAQTATRRLADISLLRAYYGGVPLISFACGFAVIAAWLAKRERGSFTMFASGLALLAFSAYGPNLVPQVVFPEYFAAALPLFLVLIAWCFGRAYASGSHELRRGITAAGCTLVAFHVASLIGQQNLHLSRDPTGLEALRDVSARVAQRVPVDLRLATLDSYFAVEADRRVADGWEMGVFAFFPRRTDPEGERLNLLTPGTLRSSLADRGVGGVLLSDHALGILVERRNSGYRPNERLGEAELHDALPALRRYRLEHVFEGFGRFDERLYFMLPVESR